MSKIKTQEPISAATSTTQKVVSETVKPIITASKTSVEKLPFLFDKQNYILMGTGLAVIIIGYALMSGGRSADPNVFDGDSLYSFRRITLAPILITIGLCIEGYAIMRKPASSN